MEKDLNYYLGDLMDVYGYENRKWKMEGSKLIRYSEEGEELYFYNLPDFDRPTFKYGFILRFIFKLISKVKKVKRLNLVNDKSIIPLNLYEKWKLFKLIKGKYYAIQKYNKEKGARKKYNDVRDTWKDTSTVMDDYKDRLKDQLREQTAREKYNATTEESRNTQYVEKSDFKKELERRAKELMDRSISKKELSGRDERIQKRINRYQDRINNGG